MCTAGADMDVEWSRIVLKVAFVLFFGTITAGCQANDKKFYEPPPQKGTVACSESALPKQFMIRWKSGVTTVVKAANRETFIREVLTPNENQIEFAEHDYVVKRSDSTVVANGLPQTGIADDWGQQRIQAAAAWSQGYEGEGVIVAVVDSGVDITHPQLRNQLFTNAGEIPANGIDDDGNGLIDDVHGYDFNENSAHVSDGSGHGTHVSGIILAEHAAGNIKGVAQKAKLLPLDFMDNSGAGNLSDAIQAMHYAADMGAKIINASWGGAPCSKSLQTAISDLGARGVLFMVASGNSGANLDTNPEYPAAYGMSNQVTVGASSPSDYMEGFSNYSDALVHLMAPGSSILSTIPNSRTEYLSGTSMATPFVSGAAAVLWGARPNATAAEIKAALLNSVDPGNYAVSSRGRLNLPKALANILGRQ
jgi:subtilisin family serine protease